MLKPKIRPQILCYLCNSRATIIETSIGWVVYCPACLCRLTSYSTRDAAFGEFLRNASNAKAKN